MKDITELYKKHTTAEVSNVNRSELVKDVMVDLMGYFYQRALEEKGSDKKDAVNVLDAVVGGEDLHEPSSSAMAANLEMNVASSDEMNVASAVPEVGGGGLAKRCATPCHMECEERIAHTDGITTNPTVDCCDTLSGGTVIIESSGQHSDSAMDSTAVTERLNGSSDDDGDDLSQIEIKRMRLSDTVATSVIAKATTGGEHEHVGEKESACGGSNCPCSGVANNLLFYFLVCVYFLNLCYCEMSF